MRHLLSRAVNPRVALRVWLENWRTISRALREPHRQRLLQIDSLRQTTLS